MGGSDKGAKKAAKQAERERLAQEVKMQQEQALADINSASEVVNVEQGGMDLPDTVQEDIRRRKGKGTATVSNQLGIS